MIEEEKKSDAKKMLWPTLAMMAFSTVWGFGNVVNGRSEEHTSELQSLSC